jgi:hypothetical protein
MWNFPVDFKKVYYQMKCIQMQALKKAWQRSWGGEGGVGTAGWRPTARR